MRRLNELQIQVHFFAGEAALLGEEDAFAAGDALGAVVELGLLAGFDASVEAGRKPKLLGLFRILAARLLTTFASVSATSISAAFKISLRWIVNATVIRCRTLSPSGNWLSSVRFSVCR